MTIKKNIEHYFRDWESYVFGYGYGSGEEHIIFALKHFLELCPTMPNKYHYDFEVLEKNLTPTVTWLLINVLCRADIIDYGCSPRFGWLTGVGMRLKEFISSRSVEELCKILAYDSSEYIPCSPTVCNCETKCCNPFNNLEFFEEELLESLKEG